MSTQTTFSLTKGDDGCITLRLNPPVNISGMGMRVDLMKRFDAVPLVSLYCSSGYNGVSGLTVANGPQGILSFPVYHQYLSGILYTNIAVACVRTDSGHVTTFNQGYLRWQP